MADETIIIPTENGPYQIQGDFKVMLGNGKEVESGGETWLCRCGQSSRKPFCDGSHAAAQFSSTDDEMS